MCSLTKNSNSKHLLVEDKSTENSQTTVEGDGFTDSEGTDSHWDNHRSKRAEGNDSYTSDERAAEIEIFVVPAKENGKYEPDVTDTIWVKAHLAVAPMYDSDPTTPTV